MLQNEQDDDRTLHTGVGIPGVGHPVYAFARAQLAIDAERDNPWMDWLAMMRLYASIGRSDDARDALRRAIRLVPPDRPDVRHSINVVYAGNLLGAGADSDPLLREASSAELEHAQHRSDPD